MHAPKEKKKDNISGKEKFGFGTWATKCIIYILYCIEKGVSSVDSLTPHHMAAMVLPFN